MPILLPVHWSTRSLRPIAAAVVALLAACDIPSSAPKWETQWGIRAGNDSVAVADVLPSDIVIEGGHFHATPAPVQASMQLAELCGGFCPTFAIPKPAFATTLVTGTTLSSDLVRATLAGNASLRARVQHNFGIDLLAPAGASTRGTLLLRLLTRLTPTAAWDTLSTTSMSGASASLPSGSTATFTLPLPAGRTVGRDVRLEVAIQSPAGGQVTLDGSRAITATLDAPTGVSFADATIVLTPRPVDGNGAALDLSSLDLDADHLRGAALDLSIDNPVAVTGAASLLVTRGNGAPLSKPFTFGPGLTTPSITFTAEELQSLRGGERSMSVHAMIGPSAASGEVLVHPTDVIRIAAVFTATVLPTGTPTSSR